MQKLAPYQCNKSKWLMSVSQFLGHVLVPLQQRGQCEQAHRKRSVLLLFSSQSFRVLRVLSSIPQTMLQGSNITRQLLPIYSPQALSSSSPQRTKAWFMRSQSSGEQCSRLPGTSITGVLWETSSIYSMKSQYWSPLLLSRSQAMSPIMTTKSTSWALISLFMYGTTGVYSPSLLRMGPQSPRVTKVNSRSAGRGSFRVTSVQLRGVSSSRSVLRPDHPKAVQLNCWSNSMPRRGHRWMQVVQCFILSEVTSFWVEQGRLACCWAVCSLTKEDSQGLWVSKLRTARSEEAGLVSTSPQKRRIPWGVQWQAAWFIKVKRRMRKVAAVLIICCKCEGCQIDSFISRGRIIFASELCVPVINKGSIKCQNHCTYHIYYKKQVQRGN